MTFFSKLKQTYANEQFRPTLLGLFINPFYFNRLGLYQAVSARLSTLEGKILDVGCGHSPYKSLCTYTEYVGLEVDTPESRKNKKADFFYNGIDMPFKNDEFDSIICNQVFEHVFTPKEFLAELNRVLKLSPNRPNLLLSFPFIWNEHEQPFDFGRYTSFGIRHLLETHGFEIVDLYKTGSGIEVPFQTMILYLYKIFFRKNAYLNLVLCLLLIAPLNIIGAIASKILPKDPDLYLDNVVLAKKVKNLQ